MNEAPWLPPAETIPACIAWWAKTTPDAPALLGIRGERVSFGRFQELIDRVGSDLSGHGIERGDRVVLALPPGVSGTIATVGVISSAVAVPVDPTLSLHEAVNTLESVHPRALGIARGEETAFREAAARIGCFVFEIDQAGSLLAASGSVERSTALDRYPVADDLALILFTSGTTDRPRLVPVRHQQLLATSSARAITRRASPGDRYLNSAPVHFLMGIVSVVESLVSGGSAIITSPPEIMRHPEIIHDLAPTWTWMSPALLESVLEATREFPSFREWPLRLVRLGGAQISPDLVARAEALWNAPVLGSYGSTETMGIASEESLDGIARKSGSVGMVRAGVDVVIRSADGSALPLGKSGEITVRGPTVFSGYLNDPEATAEAFFPDGWYRTGDLGHLDAEGYVFVTGRLREMINRGGEKVAPAEIDVALLAHPAVHEAAAFAIPDERLGEEVAAAVVLKLGATVTDRELRRSLINRLTPHKVPRRIWIVAALPRTATGKIQRRALSRRFGGVSDAPSA